MTSPAPPEPTAAETAAAQLASARTVGAKKNRRLIGQLCLLTLGAFAFGFALVPLYSVMCQITGYGDNKTLARASVVTEAPVTDREVTVEFVSTAPTFGDWTFRPEASSLKVQPGRLYEAKFAATNLRDQAVTAQAVPSIAPSQATQFFHKTECFCFTPQHFEAQQSRELTVRFIVDPKLPEGLDRLTLGYAMYTVGGKG